MNQRKLGALLSYALIGLHGIVGLVFTPFLLRMLGSSEYGLYSLVTSLIAYLTLLDLGFGDSVIRYTVRYKTEGKYNELKSLLGMFWIIYLLIAGAAIIVGIILSFNMQLFFEKSMTTCEIERAKIMMILLTINLGITFIFTIYRSFIEAHEQFIFVKSASLCRVVLNTIIMVILLNLGYKAVAQVTLITILNCIVMISFFIFAKKKLKMEVSFKNIEWGKLREILGYSIFIFLNAIIGSTFWSSGQFILGIYEGTKTVAIYAIVIQLIQMYRYFTASISGVFFPKIVALSTNPQNNTEISDLFIRIGRLQFAIILFVLLVFILFGQQFIILWAGKDYEAVFIMTLIFFIALIPAQTQQVGWIITKAKNQLKFRTYTYLFIAMTSFVLQFPISKYYSMMGTTLTIATTIILMEGFILNIYYYKCQDINIPLFWKELIRQSFAPILFTIISSFIVSHFSFNSWAELTTGVICYTIFFVPIYFIFSANNYEISLIKRFIPKFFRK